MYNFKSCVKGVIFVALGTMPISCSQAGRSPGSNDSGYESPYGLSDAEYSTFLEANGESRIVPTRGPESGGYQFLFLTEGQGQFKLACVIYPALKYGVVGMEKTGAQQVGLCGKNVGEGIHIPLVDGKSRLVVIYREYSQVRGRVETGEWMVGYPDIHANEFDFEGLPGAILLDVRPELLQFLSKQPYWLEIKNR